MKSAVRNAKLGRDEEEMQALKRLDDLARRLQWDLARILRRHRARTKGRRGRKVSLQICPPQWLDSSRSRIDGIAGQCMLTT
jgi:hypothetical protein